MQLDDEVCLCFHVSKRKVLNYIRIQRPRRPAQLSECFGAGTGCGWCRSYLKRLFECSAVGHEMADEPTSHQYAQSRGNYVREGGGQPPPGATPIDPDPLPDPDP